MMIDLIMDIFGPALLDQAKGAIAGPPGKGGLAGGTSPEDRAKSLERDHERLKLVTMALWEILSEKLNVSEDELRRKVDGAGPAGRPPGRAPQAQAAADALRRL